MNETTAEFRAEAERSIDTLRMRRLRREDGVDLLVSLMRWAAIIGKLAGAQQAREHLLEANNRELAREHKLTQTKIVKECFDDVDG
jgi:hypothetical protein